MDCSLPGSSIHGIFQARILEWVASRPPLSTGEAFQDPLWVPETMDGTELFVDCFLLCIHIYDETEFIN